MRNDLSEPEMMLMGELPDIEVEQRGKKRIQLHDAADERREIHAVSCLNKKLMQQAVARQNKQPRQIAVGDNIGPAKDKQCAGKQEAVYPAPQDDAGRQRDVRLADHSQSHSKGSDAIMCHAVQRTSNNPAERLRDKSPIWSFLIIAGNFDQVAIRVAEIAGYNWPCRPCSRHGAFDDFHSHSPNMGHRRIQRGIHDEAQIGRARHRMHGMRFKLPAMLVEIDLLIPEFQRRALCQTPRAAYPARIHRSGQLTQHR